MCRPVSAITRNCRDLSATITQGIARQDWGRSDEVKALLVVLGVPVDGESCAALRDLPGASKPDFILALVFDVVPQGLPPGRSWNG